jgi:hypothetical protein
MSMSTISSENFEFTPEAENFEFQEAEWGQESEVFNEAELMELAGELLEVNSEAELDQFLGKILKKAASAVGSVMRSPVGNAIGGFLKGVAKKALPLAGGAIGGYFGGPLGAKLGSALASAGGRALGLEAETMNAEDREFEGAKTFVRMVGDAVKSAAASPAGMNPTVVAQQAVSAAVAQHAPGIVNPQARTGASVPPPSPLGRNGQWVRKGPHIVLLNYA